MNISIVGMGIAKRADLEEFKSRPEFRKATLNMMLAAYSQDEAFAGLETCLQPGALDSSIMILGSSYGELGVTIDFLEQLSQSGVARPLLFQNSLHNSTLGFLAMRLKLKGPALTVSNSVLTGENSLVLAMTMLQEKKHLLCIVTCVDSIVTQLDLDNPIVVGSKGEGAATIILARTQTATQQGWPVLASIMRVNCFQSDSNFDLPSQTPIKMSPNAYHSDAIERLIEHLRANTFENELHLPKNDGNQTVIYLERAS